MHAAFNTQYVYDHRIRILACLRGTSANKAATVGTPWVKRKVRIKDWLHGKILARPPAIESTLTAYRIPSEIASPTGMAASGFAHGKKSIVTMAWNLSVLTTLHALLNVIMTINGTARPESTPRIF
jgi:hypothetical protein